MKHDLQLKVQAWLDGELPDREARRIGEWIARDAEASALAAELGCVKQAMFRNEAAVTSDESREFYWSQIERRIQHEAGSRSSDSPPWYARWRRYLAPATGLAVLACVLAVAIRQHRPAPIDEVSSTIDGMEAVTFQDQSSHMTVVWLQDNAPPAEIKPIQKAVQDPEKPATVVDM